MNTLIMQILKDVGCPVRFQTYNGDKETYIIFNIYLQQPEEYADDEEYIEGYYIQISIFSKSNLDTLAKKVKQKMKEADFERLSETNLYEEDTKYFHKAIRYVYYE